ncbi:hypothetical protein A3762_10295 [Oleiphilus sp. HI0125]|nr:hypothetical protein [Oleiphilus sp. HI0125]KZZ57182.1 hypothetical protein A3762_10295 [Oleiphilus sp. HI0125]
MSEIKQLEADYLIIGAGAMGLAFADELLKHDKQASIVFVERRGMSGGHWVDAYDHVKLHQPAIAYGVNSLELSESKTDLSSRPQIIHYFERISKNLVSTGRARFLFKCDFVGEQPLDKGAIATVASNIDEGVSYRIHVKRKIVDSGYMRVEVPATHPPRYKVDGDVQLVAPNALTKLERSFSKYVVVGAGKTGIDAILYLLDNGVIPERIQWVISNDMWMWPREMAAPNTVGNMLSGQLQGLIDNAEIDDAFLQMEREGIVFRLDKNVQPTKWRCATVSMPELEQLKSIKQVLRKGRVARVSTTHLHFESGEEQALSRNALIVNCSANGLAKRRAKSIFADGHITLQPILVCQQVFSAAYIGRLETSSLSDAQKNEVCFPVPHPENVEDLPYCMVNSFENLVKATRIIPWWLYRSRLNLLAQAPLFILVKVWLRIQRQLPQARRALDQVYVHNQLEPVQQTQQDAKRA